MVKKQNPTPEYDSERETRVLLEQIHSEIKTVAEQHGTIIKKLEGHDEKFDKIDQRFNVLEIAVMENSREIKKVDTKVDNLNTKLSNVERKLDTALDNHEKRIIHLEEKVGI